MLTFDFIRHSSLLSAATASAFERHPGLRSALSAHNTCLSYNKGPISSHALAVQVGQGDDEFRMVAGPHLLGYFCV